MKTQKPKKEKPVPKACVCGRPAAFVKAREGKMVTCPDPVNCVANLRTRWCSHEETVIAERNNLVCTYRGGK